MRHILNLPSILFSSFLFILIGMAPVIHAEQDIDEYKVKAIFLYNFAKFVDWPAESFVNEDSSIAICIMGNDPFGAKLNDIKGKTVKGKRIVIRHLESINEIKSCNILFVSNSEHKRLQKIFGTARSSNTLTVGDTEGFAESGIMINFYTDKNKIRLEINTNVVKGAGLKISSDLLKLAKII